MDDKMLALVKEVHRKAIEQLRAEGKYDVPEPPPIPHKELPELPTDHELYCEWNTYRREVVRFLTMGLEGGWLLIKGENVFGFYGRWEHAYIAA